MLPLVGIGVTLAGREHWAAIPEAPICRRIAYRVIKRSIDLFVAGVSLIIFSPILLILALLIKLTSFGPVLYRWDVVGRGGRPFHGYKLRTMVRNADVMKAHLMSQNEMNGPVFKMTRDPRITSVGRFLRKFSLDELPQLWSVLKGDMSLVGPRPPLQSEWPQFTTWQRRKLSVTPGMTCLWQISGRNEISVFDEWVQLDLEYIDNWSVGLDFKILLLTIPAAIRGTGK